MKMLTAEEWEKQRQEAMAAMPAVIAEVGLPKVLLPYQARTVSLLDGVCPVLFVEKSRRIGLTWGLAAYAARARRDGFTGMMAIHPSQVEPINAAFTPSAEEAARAQAIVDAFAANPGAGVLQVDGKMVDAPHLKQAKHILSLAD